MRKLLISTMLAGAALAAQPALASTVVDGKCGSVTDAAGCLFDGNINDNSDATNVNSFKYAEAQYNFYNDTHISAQPDIELNFLKLVTGDSISTSGSWDLPGFLVNFIAVKAGNQFVLYQLDTPASSGTWSTAGLVNRQGIQHGLSHYILFGDPAGGVPEPATWAMMILGFGAVGAAMRRRKAVAKISYNFA